MRKRGYFALFLISLLTQLSNAQSSYGPDTLSISDKIFSEQIGRNNWDRFVKANAKYIDTNIDSIEPSRLRLIIENSQFRRNVILGGMQLPGIIFSVNFFHGHTSFVKTMFNSVAAFPSCEFDQEANFSCATFHSAAIFHPTFFHSSCNFWRARFDSNADFQSAEFQGRADFTEAVFNSTCNFIQAKFDTSVEFNKTIFNQHAQFINAQFFSRVWFTNAVSNTSIDFRFTTFEKAVNLHGTEFGTYVNLRNSKFYDTLVLDDCQLPDTLDFRNVQITKNIDFTYCRLPKSGNKCKIALLGIDLTKIKINLEVFELWFPFDTSSITDVKTPTIEQRISFYELFLAKLKNDGLLRSYEIADKHYREYLMLNGGILEKALYYLNEWWWDFGYAKERVLKISIIALILAALWNRKRYQTLYHRVYQIPFLERSNEKITNEASWNIRYLTKVTIYTAFILFGLKIDPGKFRERAFQNHPWLFIRLMIIYVFGLFCIGFLANWIFTG